MSKRKERGSEVVKDGKQCKVMSCLAGHCFIINPNEIKTVSREEHPLGHIHISDQTARCNCLRTVGRRERDCIYLDVYIFPLVFLIGQIVSIRIPHPEHTATQNPGPMLLNGVLHSRLEVVRETWGSGFVAGWIGWL